MEEDSVTGIVPGSIEITITVSPPIIVSVLVCVYVSVLLDDSISNDILESSGGAAAGVLVSSVPVTGVEEGRRRTLLVGTVTAEGDE
jgi:preprotein translocase subunit SecG